MLPKVFLFILCEHDIALNALHDFVPVHLRQFFSSLRPSLFSTVFFQAHLQISGHIILQFSLIVHHSLRTVAPPTAPDRQLR